MSLKITAPTRIDLSGGTIDIWPIYLSIPRAITVNVAINLSATVVIKARRDKKIIIKSLDRDEEVTASSLDSLEQVEALPLPVTVIRHFSPKRGLEITMEARSPVGAGIGGSSAMMIALIEGLSKFCARKLSLDQTIQLARDLESKVIKVPSGVQDYFPAAKGGVQAIHLNAGSIRAESIVGAGAELSRRIVLCYTGEPRNSGLNNWDITKKFIDGDKRIISTLRSIAKISEGVREALINKSYDDVGALIQQEWGHRLSLSSGISTSKIDQLMNIARKAGAIGGKVCGAGGGGCVLFYCRPKDSVSVSRAVASAGGEILPFQLSTRGVKVETVH